MKQSKAYAREWYRKNKAHKSDIVCDGCGIKIQRSGSNQKFCPKCQKINKKRLGNKMWTFQGKICAKCGKIIENPKYRQKVHKECRISANSGSDYIGVVHKTFNCIICGKEFVQKNNRQKRCEIHVSDRKAINLRLRFAVLQRDNFTCQYCGRKSPEVILEIDHRTPVSKGGRNVLENLTTACFECNHGKNNNFIT